MHSPWTRHLVLVSSVATLSLADAGTAQALNGGWPLALRVRACSAEECQDCLFFNARL